MKQLSVEQVKEVKFLLLWSSLTHKEIARYIGTYVRKITLIKHGHMHRDIDVD